MLRALGFLLIGAVLVPGAAGLTGFFVDDDYCVTDDLRYRLVPPGMTCDATFEDDTGSLPAFVVALLAGGAIAALAVRRRREASAALRVATIVVAVFTIAGLGALSGAAQGGIFLATAFGIPAGYLLDRALRPSPRPWFAGVVGILVALASLVLAGFLWLLGLGSAAFGVALVVSTALVAARRVAPWAATSSASGA